MPGDLPQREERTSGTHAPLRVRRTLGFQSAPWARGSPVHSRASAMVTAAPPLLGRRTSARRRGRQPLSVWLRRGTSPGLRRRAGAAAPRRAQESSAAESSAPAAETRWPAAVGSPASATASASAGPTLTPGSLRVRPRAAPSAASAAMHAVPSQHRLLARGCRRCPRSRGRSQWRPRRLEGCHR